MSSPSARTGSGRSARDAFQQASAYQVYTDAALKAIETRDAPALIKTLQGIAEKKAVVLGDILWRRAGAVGDAAVLAALNDAYKSRREVTKLYMAAWQGSVILNNEAAMAWLASRDEVMLSFEDKAELAGLAVREGHAQLARALIAPTEKLGVHNNDKKIKLLINYLHACSANNRAQLAYDILQSHEKLFNDSFSLYGMAYQNIVMRAAAHGHAEVMQVLLKHGEKYLDDDNLAALLVASLDHNHEACARLAYRYGGDPLAFDSAAIRHAVRFLAVTVNAQHVDALERVAAIDQRMTQIEALMAGGASPLVARQTAQKWMRDDLRDEMIARIDALAQGLQARNLARLMPAASQTIETALLARVYRDATLDVIGGRYEGLLHQAVRHRVLPQLVALGAVPMPDLAAWQAKNPAGQRLIDLAIASGQMEDLLVPAVWAGKVSLLRSVLGLIDDKQMSEADKQKLQQQVKLETLRLPRDGKKEKFKL